MKISVGLQNYPRGWTHPVLAMGTFDGVHLGHQQVLRRIQEYARQQSGTSVVVTFYPHPLRILSPERAPAMLQTFGQRCAALQSAGVDVLWVIPFTLETARLSHQEFAEVLLCRQLGLRHICVGRNFHFGYGRKGNIAYLRRLGSEKGFSVEEVPEVDYHRLAIRSTGIRRLILNGRVRLAAKLLGRPAALVGTVQRGDGIGIRLGFPTANIDPQNELIPQNGVYLTVSETHGGYYPSLTNIGHRPTLEQESPSDSVRVETHLLDYSGDLYRKRIELHFLARLRSEKKFVSLEALKRQILQDYRRARRFFTRWTEAPFSIPGVTHSA